MDIRRVTFTIAADPPPRLDKALARDVPVDAVLSRTRLSRLIADGAVLVSGVAVRDPKLKVAEGALVEITVEAAQDSHIGPEDIALNVIFEDADLIVINKPAGMVVHPAPGSPSGTMVNALLHHCGEDLSGVGGVKRPGIVHRIDKDTSGLLVVAKSDAAHHGLAKQFEKHTVERYYNAVVYGVPDANDPRLRGIKGARFEAGNILRLTTQLARHKTDRQRQAVLFQWRASRGHTRAHRRAVRQPHRWRRIDGMLAGDRSHAPDPGAYGPCRARAGRRSDLWRPAQTVGKSTQHARVGRRPKLSPPSAACRDTGVPTSGDRTGPAV